MWRQATSSLLLQRDETAANVASQGVTQPGPIIHQVLTAICMVIIAVLFGLRVRALRLQSIREINVTRALVFVIYLSGLMYTFCDHLLLGGIAVNSKHSCLSAVAACFALYSPNKGFMYLFLVERAHAARASQYSRIRDWVWLFGIGLVSCGAIAIGAEAFGHLRSSFTEGVCAIVMNGTFLDVVIVADIIINTGLTGVFFVILFPALSFRTRIARMPSVASEEFITDADKPATISMPKSRKTDTLGRLDHYFRKVAIGSVLVTLPTVANLAVLKGLGNQAQMWLCLTICAVDVTTQVCVIHWLTLDRQELEDTTNGARSQIFSQA